MEPLHKVILASDMFTVDHEFLNRHIWICYLFKGKDIEVSFFLHGYFKPLYEMQKYDLKGTYVYRTAIKKREYNEHMKAMKAVYQKKDTAIEDLNIRFEHHYLFDGRPEEDFQGDTRVNGTAWEALSRKLLPCILKALELGPCPEGEMFEAYSRCRMACDSILAEKKKIYIQSGLYGDITDEKD